MQNSELLMARPWVVIGRFETPEGAIELRQRGERDFLVMLGAQVLMSSTSNRSEIELGRIATAPLAGVAAPRVLVSGLGMGFTLRAVLDGLSDAARVTVVELNPIVVGWCRGPLAALTGDALGDPRVTVVSGDVTDTIRTHARPGAERFDAIVLDLYRGPHTRTEPVSDPIYGADAIAVQRAALAPKGVLAVWGEVYDSRYDRRLGVAGFRVATKRPVRGKLKHAIFVGLL
jgi:spermidine synthase